MSPHAHPHTYADRPHPEFVVLDIGEDLGALIVHTTPEFHGVEIHLSRSGEDDRRQHKEVLERRAGGEPAFTAVFDALPAGRYTVWVEDQPLARGVRITGAGITELDWRSVPQPA